jgi:predicted nucleotidyltransferase
MTVKTKQDVIQILQKHQGKLNNFGVNRLGLFGSFVRNTASNESDIDLLVVFEASQKNFNNFMNLSFFLEDLLGRKVDLVTLESLSPYIGKSILQEVEYV